jgi:hypothetical protein
VTCDNKRKQKRINWKKEDGKRIKAKQKESKRGIKKEVDISRPKPSMSARGFKGCCNKAKKRLIYGL